MNKLNNNNYITPPSNPVSGRANQHSPVDLPGRDEGMTLTRQQLRQIADMLIPYIENKIFGDPKIDLEEQKKMTPKERTRFVARLLAKEGTR